jgi:hypothetical protein
MNQANCTELAESAFRRIAERFPALKMDRNEAEAIELNIDIPVQPGLKYAVNLNLQNEDELHFSVENLWLEWFPCTDPSRVNEYVEAVSGFLEGRYRIVELFRGTRCIKAELQAPLDCDGWETIGSSVHLGLP